MSISKGTRFKNYPVGTTLLLIGVAVFALHGGRSDPVAISACVQTESVKSPPDAADDVAVWVNRAVPAESLVIATDKKAGLHVYDLTGRETQFLPIGRVNNVDLRLNFPFPDGVRPIIAVSNRSDHSITLLRFDEETKRIEPEPVAILPGYFQEKLQGVCLYRAEDGDFHVGASDRSGSIQQWRLKQQPDSSITAERVRGISFTSSTEGCVYDDELGYLYVGEEEVALWKVPADPRKGNTPILVDSAGTSAGFSPDIEGLAIYARSDRTGYIVASIQGESNFRLYRREGDNAYVGSFRVVGCPTGSVDAVTTTDGIEVTSVPLGSDWPAGLLVVQDNKKTHPPGNQNFKLVRWDDVEKQLGIGHTRSWGQLLAGD